MYPPLSRRLDSFLGHLIKTLSPYPLSFPMLGIRREILRNNLPIDIFIPF